MNGHQSDGDSSGFSSDDEHRYPPQMVLTPIPGSSPITTEDNNNNTFGENRPPAPLSRFSFEVSYDKILASSTLFVHHNAASIMKEDRGARRLVSEFRCSPNK